VAALKEITAIAGSQPLNHGSIHQPPYRAKRASVVLGKIERWSGRRPRESKSLATAAIPVIRLRISEVDYESIIEKAKGEDNDGRPPRETLKKLAWEGPRPHRTLTGDIFGASHARLASGADHGRDVRGGSSVIVRDRSWLSRRCLPKAGPGHLALRH